MSEHGLVIIALTIISTTVLVAIIYLALAIIGEL